MRNWPSAIVLAIGLMLTAWNLPARAAPAPIADLLQPAQYYGPPGYYGRPGFYHRRFYRRRFYYRRYVYRPYYHPYRHYYSPHGFYR